MILLAGCGLGDGSCMEENVLTYTVLDKYHLDYTPVAEDTSIRSVNHITEQPEENRHLLKDEFSVPNLFWFFHVIKAPLRIDEI